MRKLVCVQENAWITQARTNVPVILDTVDQIVRSTLTNASPPLANKVNDMLLLFSSGVGWQVGHKNNLTSLEILMDSVKLNTVCKCPKG